MIHLISFCFLKIWRSVFHLQLKMVMTFENSKECFLSRGSYYFQKIFWFVKADFQKWMWFQVIIIQSWLLFLNCRKETRKNGTNVVKSKKLCAREINNFDKAFSCQHLWLVRAEICFGWILRAEYFSFGNEITNHSPIYLSGMENLDNITDDDLRIRLSNAGKTPPLAPLLISVSSIRFYINKIWLQHFYNINYRVH